MWKTWPRLYREVRIKKSEVRSQIAEVKPFVVSVDLLSLLQSDFCNGPSSQLRSSPKQYILLTSSMAKLFELPRYIAVEGPIRVGKSTLAQVLGERLAAQRVIEPEDNPFLKAFYEGAPGAGFQTQLAFLIRRFQQLSALDLGPRSNKTIVADYIFEKDKLFACLNLNDQELDTYNRYFNHFREQLPTPDLVIYLQATPDDLKKRLKKKNAPGEKAISEDYLMEVVKAYEHFFFHYTQSDLLI